METGVNSCTGCVGCEYYYGKRGLLEQRANSEWLSLLCGAALCVPFVTNSEKSPVVGCFIKTAIKLRTKP